MKSVIKVSIIAAAGIAGAVTANAHHSYATQFDRNQTVEFSGTVTRIEWTNPHSRFYVDGVDPDMEGNTPVGWNIEITSASILMRQGWRHDTLKEGDTVTVTATRARLDPHVVNASRVVRDSGEELFRRRADQLND